MPGARPDPESDALHARAREWVSAFERGEPMPEPFDALGLDLARFQARRIPGVSRLHAARGVDAARASRLGELPAVPTDAFRHMRVATFPEDAARAVFHTSGTTGAAQGRHAFRDLSTYEAGAVAFGRAALVGGLAAPPAPVVLAPPPSGTSSLGHMLARFVEALCAPARGARVYFVEGERLLVEDLARRIDALRRAGEPALVMGTSFAFVHLLDAGASGLALPAGSRVMHTGGFKGRSREVGAEELRAALARTFAIPDGHVGCEYGMTELSSQLYEATLARPDAAKGVYLEPPWARVVPVDPETLAPVPDGEVGLARVEDLLNVDSAVAIQTQDRVVRVSGGVRLLGRAPGAPPRGCSLAVDDLLGRAR